MSPPACPSFTVAPRYSTPRSSSLRSFRPCILSFSFHHPALIILSKKSNSSTDTCNPRQCIRCVPLEACGLPDDVARRTLCFSSIPSMFHERRPRFLLSFFFLGFFNDTPARACKQLRRARTTNVSHSHGLFFFFLFYFFHFFSLYFVRLLVVALFVRQTVNGSARKSLSSHIFSSPLEHSCREPLRCFILFFLPFPT